VKQPLTASQYKMLGRSPGRYISDQPDIFHQQTVSIASHEGKPPARRKPVNSAVFFFPNCRTKRHKAGGDSSSSVPKEFSRARQATQGLRLPEVYRLDNLNVFENLELLFTSRNIKAFERETMVYDRSDRFQIVGARKTFIRISSPTASSN
jgi:hypothetical protein